MPKKLTQEEFITKSNIKHGGVYDYSKVVYVNSTTKVEIDCEKHGIFIQAAGKHVSGDGCPKCGNEKIGKKLSKGKSDFIKKSINVWGENKFDYSKVVYKNNSTKIKLIDRETGIEFEQSPASHLKGILSNKFTKNEPYTTDSFIKKSIDIWGEGVFDYSEVEYKTAHHKIKLKCKNGHIFEQLPSSHLNKKDCPYCKNVALLTSDEYIKKCYDVWGESDHSYDLDSIKYEKMSKNIVVSCSKHGDFFTKPQAFLNKSGCNKCFRERFNETHPTRSDTVSFIEKAKTIHNDYDYSKVEYVNNSMPVILICPDGHEFKQTPQGHLSGRKCSICQHKISSQEEKIKQFLIDNNFKFKDRDRTIIKPYELDFILPDYKIAIEVNGIIWHSEKFGKGKDYHIMKTNLCNDKEYTLVHLFEDEINNDFDNITNNLLKLIKNQNKFDDNNLILNRRFYNFAPDCYKIIEETEPDYTYSKSNSRITKEEYNLLENKKGWYRIWDCGKLICERF